ncbi:DoxX family protein [Actinophytocola oryzae]|uniref:Putative membrane protein YphA (DoxX/SURF4 family) n=1 Tax=Actinophytocola oryzae TaxID=502181 RepID=A0A4R7VFY0_9PSEU|nr:DoxX family protein [Actinophytocola oryzae]TDV48025.1 putative membrane protein YphA (DoxX/SURF4 family) [Actinophytocola oryzae]
MILRRIARPMLAAVFVSGGIDTLRNPKPRVAAAAPAIDKAVEQVGDKLPAQVPTDPEMLVKINAAAQVGAGVLFGLGKFPRLSAFVLAASLAPTTVAGHRFWEQEDPASRAAQRTHFLKNLGLLGGLIIAAADTHGKPSLTWRARHATDALAGSVQGTVHGAAASVQGTARSAVGSLEEAARSAVGSVEGAAKSARGSVQGVAKSARGSVEGVAKSARGSVEDATKSVQGTARSVRKKLA